MSAIFYYNSGEREARNWLAQGSSGQAASRGLPRSFTAQKNLVQDDNQAEPLPGINRVFHQHW